MNKTYWVIIVSIAVFGQLSFVSKNDYSPMRICVKGKIPNLKTATPLKKTNVYIYSKQMDEIDFNPEIGLIDFGKTDNKGEFLIDTHIDKSNLQFWIKINEFAQLNVCVPKIDTSKLSDTIHLGTIYFVPYQNELEVESYNMPKSKPIREKEIYEKYSIAQVDSIFNLTGSNYGMILNPVDTVDGSITRYNFGPNKARGTKIKKYKQITFKMTIN